MEEQTHISSLKKKYFWKYVPINATVQQVSGAEAPVKGMGIVLARLKVSNMIITLYHAYHMPENPQHTLGLPALKYYNDMQSVRTGTLRWIQLVDQDGRKVMQETIKRYHTTQLMDYINITIMSAEKGGMDVHQPSCERMKQRILLKDSRMEYISTPPQ